MTLSVKSSQTPKGRIIHLTGVIDETVDFEKLLGAPSAAEMVVNCSGISRMNSVGVKAWVTYFEKAQRKGAKLVLQECSPIIVEQLNAIMNFACGGKIESVQLGFTCSSCSHAFTALAKIDVLKANGTEIEDRKCPKCGGDASFDDFPEEYFRFLESRD